MQQTRIAIIELNSQSDILANLTAIEHGVSTAYAHDAQLVVLPENAFCFGNQALASQYFDALSDWCRQLARHYHIHLLAGTLPCAYRPDGKLVPDGKFRQSSLLFDPSGQQIARYDKIHLFKATVNDKTGNYDEAKTFEAGDTPVVADTDIGKIGLMVCFDIRFAPLAIRLRDMGAQILTAPSAFTYQTGKAHWQALLTARALDSQCLIVGAGQTGSHYIVKADKTIERQTWGHSQFVNANGEIAGKSLMLSDTDVNHPLPLTQAAMHWLPAQTIDPNIVSPIANRMLITDFNSVEQQRWRAHIDLQASQRFIVGDIRPLPLTPSFEQRHH